MIFVAVMILLFAVGLTAMIAKSNRLIRENRRSIREPKPEEEGMSPVQVRLDRFKAILRKLHQYAADGNEAGFEAMLLEMRAMEVPGNEDVSMLIETTGREILKNAKRLKEQAP